VVKNQTVCQHSNKTMLEYKTLTKGSVDKIKCLG